MCIRDRAYAINDVCKPLNINNDSSDNELNIHLRQPPISCSSHSMESLHLNMLRLDMGSFFHIILESLSLIVFLCLYYKFMVFSNSDSPSLLFCALIF